MKNVKVEASFIDSIKNFNFSAVVQSIKNVKIDWGMTAIFLGAGFLMGFLFKRYSKMFIISLVVGLVLIWGLDHFFHVINWETVNGMLGDNPAKIVDSFFNASAQWISQNVSLAIGFGSGIVIGILFI